MVKTKNIECICIPAIIIDAIRCYDDPYDQNCGDLLWTIINYAEYGSDPDESERTAFYERARELICEVNKDATEA